MALIVIRHLNKSAGGPVLYRGGGSIGIIGAARIGLVVGADPEHEERRVLAPVKANLSRPPAALAFRLVEGTNRAVTVKWEGSCQLTAEQLLALPADGGSPVLSEAQHFLRLLLDDGPILAREAKQQARDAGISDITLRRAREALGVHISRSGFGADGQWLWTCHTP
jgi:hypothetical protein